MNYKEVIAYIAMAIGVGISIGYLLAQYENTTTLNLNNGFNCECEELIFIPDNNETNTTDELFFIEDKGGDNE
ncbi:MAG: hypothetical protein COA39_000130 [Sulfurimonas sp.]|nr:hypothetical protein [Sulfurimonas sp.]